MSQSIDDKTYELVNELLEEYHSTLDESKREKLKALVVTRMLPIVKKIAHRIARRSYDPIDDLIQAGSIGLLKAIENYSKVRNDNFKFYAGYLIIGEIKHYLRDKMTTIRVPRYIQELSIRINSFIKTLTVEELNELTNEDVADALNLSTKMVNIVQQTERRKNILSLDSVYSQEQGSLGYEELISGENTEEKQELKDITTVLDNIITKLPEDLKKLVKLYYYEDYSQKELAEKFGMSPMQVSRALKKAFSIMRDTIIEKNLIDREQNI